MSNMITDIEDYFGKGCGRCAKFATPECSVQHWAAGLAELRGILLSVGLSETVKWGHPCYMHADRNIANIGAFRSNYRLNFFNAGLLKDPDKVLEKQGPNTANPGMISFTANEDVQARAPVIRAYLAEAMGYAERGLRAPKNVAHYDVPDELTDALDMDAAFADAFNDLTPGRKRGYYMHIGGAKQSKTRTARIESLRGRIFAGKGFNERL